MPGYGRLAAADAVGGTIAKLSGYSPHNRRGTPVSREGAAEGKQKPKEPTFSARWVDDFRTGQICTMKKQAKSPQMR
jgi:hypothetical protein